MNKISKYINNINNITKDNRQKFKMLIKIINLLVKNFMIVLENIFKLKEFGNKISYNNNNYYNNNKFYNKNR